MITDEHRRNHLNRLVEAWDLIFDPQIVGLRHSGPKPRRNAPACGAESLHYALALLEMAERSRQGRAEAVINRLVEAPASRDASALTLALIWHRHRRRLPSALTEKIKFTLGAAANSIHSIDTQESLTSPAESISGIFVALTAAHIADDTTLHAHAINRLKVLAEHANPPTRAARDAAGRDLAIILAGLRAIDTYIRESGASGPLEAALMHFQRESLPALQKQSGKAPDTDLLPLLVSSAIRGIQCGSPDSGRRSFAALYACVMKIESPAIRISDEAALPAR